MHRLAEKRVLSFVKVIGRRENVKGKKFSIAYQGAFESEKKSKTTLPGFVLTHHLVFRGYFVILTNLKRRRVKNGTGVGTTKQKNGDPAILIS